MKRPVTQINKVLKSLCLALLIAVPPIYQALHQAFSGHNHFTFTDQHQVKYSEQAAKCYVVEFTFFAQIEPSEPPSVSNPIAVEFTCSSYTEPYFPDDIRNVASPRAPPVS